MKTNKITIIEVGPRDGFQSVSNFILTKNKITIIENLLEAKIPQIQLTSFINPKVIPQMADGPEIWDWYKHSKWSTPYDVLVPSLGNGKRAAEVGLKHLSFVISASESHNKSNVNRTIEQSFNDLGEFASQYPEITLKLDIATAFQCPFEGTIPLKQVMNFIERGLFLGIKTFDICETLGSASPQQVKTYLREIAKTYGTERFVLHLHNTFGLALCNAMVAIEEGFTSFETSIGGLGGCPFAPGAAGNLATEDLCYFLSKQGMETDIDMGGLLTTVSLLHSIGLEAQCNSSVGSYALKHPSESYGNWLLP
jgi:hydroxymethylglutaryl-CoA lyase